MKSVVLFSSKSGNSGKIADAIASELSCHAVKIDSNSSASTVDLKDYELVFVGTGIYAGTPNKDLENCLKTANLGGPKLFAIFVTWGGAGNTCQAVTAKLRGILEAKGQKVIEDTFCCYGGWKYALLRRGHPNSEDTQAAKKWAKNLVSNLQK